MPATKRRTFASELEKGDVVEGRTISAVRKVSNNRVKVYTTDGEVRVYQTWERVIVEAAG